MQDHVEFLKKLSINQSEIAERLKVNKRTLQNYLSRSNKMPDSIKKLIEYEFGTENTVAEPTAEYAINKD